MMFEPTLTFVRIPKATWESYPVDRTFAAASADLTGMERKIAKGVQTSLEQMRHHHLSTLLEARVKDAIIERRLDRLILKKGGYLIYRRTMLVLHGENKSCKALTLPPVPAETKLKAEKDCYTVFYDTVFKSLAGIRRNGIVQTFHALSSAYRGFHASLDALHKEQARRARWEVDLSVAPPSIDERQKLCCTTIFPPGRSVMLLQRLIEIAPYLDNFTRVFAGNQADIAVSWLKLLSPFLEKAVADGDAVVILSGHLLAEERGKTKNA